MNRKDALTFLGLVFLTVRGGAWDVGPRSDAEIISSQLVVIAHIQPNSLNTIPHGGSYETQATLVVQRVIKGECTSREIPIMIHYGVIPVAKNRADKIEPNFDRDLPFSYSYSEPIPLFEDNPSEGFTLVASDIRLDQIWFLQKYIRGRGPTFDGTVMTNNGWIGVLEFRDVQPLAKEASFRKIAK